MVVKELTYLRAHGRKMVFYFVWAHCTVMEGNIEGAFDCARVHTVIDKDTQPLRLC